MKLADKFKLALLGAGVLGLTLYVFGEEAEEEALTYPSVEACVKAGVTDEATCKAEFTKAQNLHNQVAPRYATSGNCYSDYGYNRCYQNRMSGGSVWLPFMMGYMLAPRGGAAYISSQPLYRTSASPNRYYTGANHPVGAISANGRTQVATSKVSRPPVRTRTVARGGFGKRAAGRSAGG